MNVKAPLLTSHPIVFRREGDGGLVTRLRAMESQNGRKFEFPRKILKRKRKKNVALKLQSLFAEVIAVICTFTLKIVTLWPGVMDTLSSYNEVTTNP